MLKDSLIGLAIALFVISSIAWVGQFRRIRNRIKINKAMRAESETAAKTSEWTI